MPEPNKPIQDVSELDRKLRCGIDEDGASRSQHPAAFCDPAFTPAQVVELRHLIVVPVFVILAQIERWIGKDTINT